MSRPCDFNLPNTAGLSLCLRVRQMRRVGLSEGRALVELEVHREAQPSHGRGNFRSATPSESRIASSKVAQGVDHPSEIFLRSRHAHLPASASTAAAFQGEFETPSGAQGPAETCGVGGCNVPRLSDFDTTSHDPEAMDLG
jgi:hypothetical protein